VVYGIQREESNQVKRMNTHAYSIQRSKNTG
jgi:hypothetical protein